MSSVKQLAVWNSSSSASSTQGIFVGELDCLQHLVNSILLQSFELPMRTDNDNFLRQLYGATFFTYEARCNLASPTCRKPCQEGRDPADKIDPIVAPRVGRLVTTTFTGPLGARSRFTSALSVFFPSNAFMAFARSLHTFNRSKKMNCKLSCKAVYPSIASKALVMDQYTVQ